MSSRFTELVVDSRDPKGLAGFWQEVLGWEATDSLDDYVILSGEEKGHPSLMFVQVPDNKTVKNRLHMDLSPRDRDQHEEVARLETLGARRVDIGQGEDATWVVMADPEDNEFCVTDARQP